MRDGCGARRHDARTDQGHQPVQVWQLREVCWRCVSIKFYTHVCVCVCVCMPKYFRIPCLPHFAYIWHDNLQTSSALSTSSSSQGFAETQPLAMGELWSCCGHLGRWSACNCTRLPGLSTRVVCIVYSLTLVGFLAPSVLKISPRIV